MEYMGQVLTGIVLWSMVLMLLLGSVYIYIQISVGTILTAALYYLCTEKLENLNSAKMTTDQSQQNRLLKPKSRQKQSRESRSQGSRKTSTASLRAKK